MNGLDFEGILALLSLRVLGNVSHTKKAIGTFIKPWKEDGALFLR